MDGWPGINFLIFCPYRESILSGYFIYCDGFIIKKPAAAVKPVQSIRYPLPGYLTFKPEYPQKIPTSPVGSHVGIGNSQCLIDGNHQPVQHENDLMGIILVVTARLVPDHFLF